MISSSGRLLRGGCEDAVKLGASHRVGYTPAVRKLAFVAALVVLAPACALTDSSQPVPGAQAVGKPGRVVLVSLDGVAANRHRQNLRDGVYTDRDGLNAFEATGYVVENAIPVNPPLTAVSHASIATGALPSVTGIVANVFHLPGTPIVQAVSGFDAPWGGEPLWQTFRRQGRRVGVLTFPGCDGTSPPRTADFGMLYVNRPYAPPTIVSLKAAQFQGVVLPSGWVSYTPPRRATISVNLAGPGGPGVATFTLTTLDTTDDRVADFDTLMVDDDADLTDGTLARVRAGEWFPLRVRAQHPDGGTRTLGSWCLLQTLSPDLSAVKLYRGGFFSTEAYPRQFRERLEERAGFWPGPGDERALERALSGQDGLQLPEFLEQTRRFSEYFNACARATIEGERFDLLVLYQPVVDEVEHVLLVTQPQQRAYSKEFAATTGGAVTEAYLMADRAVGALARELDLSRDALVVVSDHGMAPVWETAHINQLLQHAGLTEGEQVERGWRVKASSKIVAFGAGGCINLYVNLKGREPGGVVEPGETAAVVQAAAVALANAQVDGHDVVEAMFRQQELTPLGLANPNAGDLVVFLHPGFTGTSAIGAPGEPFHAPAEIAGQHGFLNTHPEMAAVWLARGAGVPIRRVRTASLTEVAAFLARLAGVQPPAQATPWRQ
jgi:predicted AlkP superfamily phosphohydrolase/phosphomutase